MSAEQLVRPSSMHISRHHSEEVVSVDERGLHVNHLEGHHEHTQARFGSMHTYEAEEAEAFAMYINTLLADEKGVEHLLPLDTTSKEVFTKQADGLILLYLLKRAAPSAVDEHRINRPRTANSSRNLFERNENLNYFLTVAHEQGCNFVNIGVSDITEAKEIPILSILWQLFHLLVLGDVHLKQVPGLVALLRPHETMQSFLHHQPEVVLLRWMKYLYESDGEQFKCSNFGQAMKDPYVFLKVEHVLEPSLPFDASARDDASPAARLEMAKQVLANAAALGAQTSVRPADLLSSASSVKIAFAAALFQVRNGLPPVDNAVRTSIKELPNPPTIRERSNKDNAVLVSTAPQGPSDADIIADHVAKALAFATTAEEAARRAAQNAEDCCSLALSLSEQAAEEYETMGNGNNRANGDELMERAAFAQRVSDEAMIHSREAAKAAVAARAAYDEAVVCVRAGDAEAARNKSEQDSRDARAALEESDSTKERMGEVIESFKQIRARQAAAKAEALAAATAKAQAEAEAAARAKTEAEAIARAQAQAQKQQHQHHHSGSVTVTSAASGSSRNITSTGSSRAVNAESSGINSANASPRATNTANSVASFKTFYSTVTEEDVVPEPQETLAYWVLRVHESQLHAAVDITDESAVTNNNNNKEGHPRMAVSHDRRVVVCVAGDSMISTRANPSQKVHTANVIQQLLNNKNVCSYLYTRPNADSLLDALLFKIYDLAPALRPNKTVTYDDETTTDEGASHGLVLGCGFKNNRGQLSVAYLNTVAHESVSSEGASAYVNVYGRTTPMHAITAHSKHMSKQQQQTNTKNTMKKKTMVAAVSAAAEANAKEIEEERERVFGAHGTKGIRVHAEVIA